MPAEWEGHAETWTIWPHNTKDWPGRFQPIPWVFTDFVRILSRFEKVCILTNSDNNFRQADRYLRLAGVDLDRIRFLRCATDRCWTRDSGPTFVKEGTVTIALCWQFNAWAKYPDHKKDAEVSEKIARNSVRLSWKPVYQERHVVLEGGAIDVDGAGNLLATEECLLSEKQCRNPGFTKNDYEAIFAEYLGASQVIWLGRGIAGDDTHGHIDDVARFVAEGVVLLAWEENPKDENYTPLHENYDRLSGAKPRDIIRIPMPRPIIFKKQRVPASYLNFYIANGVVLVPTFNDPADRKALGILADCFPGREIIGIHSGDLIWGLGTLHCMTQQEPL